MKHIILTLFTLTSSLLTLHAAIPLKWTVETSRAVPAQFEAYQGETLAIEAALQSYGKPLEAPLNYSLYWQTNGMGSTYWSVPCVATASSPSNVLYATWSPTNDVGAKVYNCFIGQPGTIYHAAFQLRLRPSPGATPNELPLPQKVIDFAKVRVLNPPWSGGGGGGGVDTNAVREIVDASFDGGTNAVNISLTNRYTKSETDELLDDKADKSEISGKLDTVNPSPGQDWHFVVWGDDGRLHVVGGLSSTSIETLGIEGLQGLTLDGASQPPGYANWNLISIKIGSGNYIMLQDALDDKADKTELAAKQDALPYPTNAIPASVIIGLEPPSETVIRVRDVVLQCWWIGRMVNGVINWEVE